VTETLRQKQSRFVRLTGLLIEYAYSQGYELTFGEAYRTPEQAALNAKAGTGIANSLHTQRLAIDLMLFKDGRYLTDSADYGLLGEYWESLAQDCAWGGRFKRPDGNHFSIRHGGRA
jgi:hypothetical protein